MNEGGGRENLVWMSEWELGRRREAKEGEERVMVCEVERRRCLELE